MSNYVLAAFAGIIQGLTEFLPISSSGHLVLFHDYLKFDLPDNVAFDVTLHLGTLVALLLFFWRDVIRYIFAFLKSFVRWNVRNDIDQRLAWYLAIATIPGVIAGALWEDIIDSTLRNTVIVAVMMIAVGILLFVVDRFSKRQYSLDSITLPGAVGVGVAQAFALIPGVSRSGITIIAGLVQNLNRESAARFSFLLSMPIVAGAGAKKIFDLFTGSNGLSGEGTTLAIGFVTSAIVGYLCIKFFLKYLQSHSLAIFAYYRVILGVAILALLFWA